MAKIGFRKEIDWQRSNRFRKRGAIKAKEGKGRGLRGGFAGYCVCPECGFKEEHKRGIPCASIKCPHCGHRLEREI